MRLIAALWSPLEAMDQSGIQFPLAADDLDWLGLPTQPCLARAISSWRLSVSRLAQRHGSVLDQWGIEFPIAYDELAVPSGRLRASYRLVVSAAILTAVVAGGASTVPSSATPTATPSHNQPGLVAAASPTSSLRPITEQPSTTPVPTAGPTPGATLPVVSVPIKPEAITPAAALDPLQPPAFSLPTVQDARNYLVARLGTRVDRRLGLSQAQCASRIFEYEANWDPHATNKYSGAYGLPQANPASKLAAWAEAKATAAAKAGDANAARLYRAWRDNPVVQAEWGVDYMITRYGSPCAALAFRNRAGWY